MANLQWRKTPLPLQAHWCASLSPWASAPTPNLLNSCLHLWLPPPQGLGSSCFATWTPFPTSPDCTWTYPEASGQSSLPSRCHPHLSDWVSSPSGDCYSNFHSLRLIAIGVILAQCLALPRQIAMKLSILAIRHYAANSAPT